MACSRYYDETCPHVGEKNDCDSCLDNPKNTPILIRNMIIFWALLMSGIVFMILAGVFF